SARAIRAGRPPVRFVLDPAEAQTRTRLRRRPLRADMDPRIGAGGSGDARTVPSEAVRSRPAAGLRAQSVLLEAGRGGAAASVPREPADHVRHRPERAVAAAAGGRRLGGLASAARGSD